MFKRIDSKWFLVFLVALLGAGFAIPVLADYLGPNRTVTTYSWERSRCEYEARHPSEVYGCVLTLYYPPNSCPALSPATNYGYFNTSQCPTWTHNCAANQCSINLTGQSIDGCSDGQTGCRNTAHTTTNPPATISGGISCSQTGSNGWCTGTASLSLSAAEPLSGQSITLLEGTRNGVSFACPGASCSVPLLQGQNDFTYWALSTWGDSSLMGGASGRLDSQPPQISGSLDGIPGDNGWYVSEVTLSASATDPTPGSGLAAFSASLDGSAVSLPAVIGAGSHSVLLQAADNAGLTASQSLTVQIDTGMPSVNLSAGASFCPGCGQTLPVSFSISDAGSGIASWTLSADGAPLTSGNSAGSQSYTWNGSGLGGGAHTLELQAVDLAGNSTATDLSVSILLPTATPVPPTATQPPQGGGGSSGGSTGGSTGGGQTSDPGNAPAGSSVSSTPSATATRQSILTLFGIASATPEGSVAVPQPAGPGGEPEPADEFDPLNNVAWGATAAGMIGAATYLAYEATRKRKEEEEQARAAAELANANAGAREKGFKDYADQLEWEKKAAADRAFIQAVQAEQEARAAQLPFGGSEISPSLPIGVSPETEISVQAGESKAREGIPNNDKSLFSSMKKDRDRVPTMVATPSATPTLTPNSTPQPTRTPTPTPTLTTTPTHTYTPSPTQTPTPTPTAVQPASPSLLQKIGKGIQQVLYQQITVGVQTVDTLVDKLWSDYQGPAVPPKEVQGIVSLHYPSPNNSYHQNQNLIPVTGAKECVTTSAISAVNMMNEWAAQQVGVTPLPNIDVIDFANSLNNLGPQSKRYRDEDGTTMLFGLIDTGGWMRPKTQLIDTLNDFSTVLRQQYGCGYTVVQTPKNDVGDLIYNLQNNRITLIHGIWDNPVVYNGLIDWSQLLGGTPHTMIVVGYNASIDTWQILDTGSKTLYTPSTQELYEDFWGRRYLFNLYTPRLSMTTIIPDSSCPVAPPANPPTGSLTDQLISQIPDLVLTPTPTQTINPTPTVTSTATPSQTTTPTPTSSSTNVPTDTADVQSHTPTPDGTEYP